MGIKVLRNCRPNGCRTRIHHAFAFLRYPKDRGERNKEDACDYHSANTTRRAADLSRGSFDSEIHERDHNVQATKRREVVCITWIYTGTQKDTIFEIVGWRCRAITPLQSVHFLPESLQSLSAVRSHGWRHRSVPGSWRFSRDDQRTWLLPSLGWSSNLVRMCFQCQLKIKINSSLVLIKRPEISY